MRCLKTSSVKLCNHSAINKSVPNNANAKTILFFCNFLNAVFPTCIFQQFMSFLPLSAAVQPSVEANDEWCSAKESDLNGD